MDRRKFLGVVTGMAGTTVGLGMVKAGLDLAPSPIHAQKVAFQVKGFTCITCATGLEVMLLREKGVVRAAASYPEARVVIEFDDGITSQDKLKEFIGSCGFTVA